MVWLIVGIVVFFGVHLVPACPRLRGGLVQRIGEMPYKGVFSVIALAGLGFIVLGMGRAQTIAVWQPPAVGSTATLVFMAPALILLAAANLNGHIKRIARHPMSLGVLLWALSHLLSNGDLASLLFFGSFAVYALFDMRPGKAESVTPAQPDAVKTVSMKWDWLAVVIGLAVYFLLAAFHRHLFGVAVFPS